MIQECQKEIAKRRHQARRKKKAKFVPSATPFEGFDFANFWDDHEYVLKKYVSDPLFDELIASVEEELGYKLSASYIWLMKRHNGGMPVNTCYPTDEPTSWAEDHVASTDILGIGREKACSLCGELGSQFMIDEWDYSAIGVTICDCLSAGHDMIFLDYRACGPQGEPTAVHVDQENDYKITHLADSFEEFIRGLEPKSSFDEDEDDEAEPSEETDADHTCIFTGFVLLSKGEWDKEQFIRDMKEKWDIPVDEDDASGEKADDALVFEVAVCCRQKYATGIYTSGVVFEPQFYEGFADTIKNGELPIFNWIWFGLWRSEDGLNGYTYGMEKFGKDEMEVLGTSADPNVLRDFLASLTSYVLENDVELHDGETIGFAEDDKHAITRGPGVGLPEDQMTLKISWKGPDGEGSQDKESGVPKVYTEEEMEAIEGHIQQYFGEFEHVFHELVSPDIHVDICVVSPSE